jgi:hypothetical protein
MKIDVPDHEAKWAKKVKWNPIEAAILCMGFDPDDIGHPIPKVVRCRIHDRYGERSGWRFQSVLRRAGIREMGIQLPDEELIRINSKSPVDWLAWVQSENFDRPNSLRILVDKYHKQAWSAEDEEPISSRERSTVMKLITAAAIRKYGYDLKAKKNGAAVNAIISDIKDIFGHAPHQRTVRDWLKKACAESELEVR